MKPKRATIKPAKTILLALAALLLTPVAALNATGGQSLYQNFRPPSAGLPAGAKPEDFGNQYRGLIGYVHDTLTNLKKGPVTAEEQAMLRRATSNQGYRYYGEGRFFILLGQAFAETMLELQGT